MKAISTYKNPAILEILPKVSDLEIKVLELPSISLSKKSDTQTSDKFSNSEFLSAITHELKTPLNAIIGFADILSEEITSKESQEDCLNYILEIKQAAADMNELVHDILDVAQFSSGNFSVNLNENIDPKDFIKRATRLNYDYALRRNIDLKTEISDEVSLIKLDSRRMKQILTNLISNAVKYSPKHSEVKIACKNNANFLEISVIDQGFGIAKEQIKTVFEKYQTITNPNSGSVDSFGLGLAITKQLVELQNGKIEVESEINQGTKMTIKFHLNPL
jgi:signal transduction histidine kinase